MMSKLYKISLMIFLSTLITCDISLSATNESMDLAQQLYVSYYGRPADPGGQSYWAGVFDGTDDLDEALLAFGTSEEYTTNFGSMTNEALVTNLYQQLFGRDPDAAGLEFYAGRLSSGETTLATIAKQIADGASGDDLTTMNNKIIVANTYTSLVSELDAVYDADDIENAQAILASVDETDNSVTQGNTAATSEVTLNASGSDSILNGSYMVNGMDLDELDLCTWRAELVFDGNGSLTFQSTADSEGYVDSGSMEYSVANDLALTLYPADDDDPVNRGQVNYDGSFFFFAVAKSGFDPKLGFGIKISSGLSNATLSGTYITSEAGGSGDDFFNLQATMIFSGDGTGSYQTIINSHGGTESGSITYSVASDGALTIFDETGQVSSDGSVICFTRASENDIPTLSIGIKKSSGLSTSTLNGTYTINVFSTEDNNENAYACNSEVTFDGNGTGTYHNDLADTDGELHSGTFTYSVADDGTLTFSADDGIYYEGQISPDGNLFVITAWEDDEKEFIVGIKSQTIAGTR